MLHSGTVQKLFRQNVCKHVHVYYQLWGSLVKIVGSVLQFVVLTIRSCQKNHQYQRDVLLADFGKFGKSWRFADNYLVNTKRILSCNFVMIKICFFCFHFSEPK